MSIRTPLLRALCALPLVAFAAGAHAHGPAQGHAPASATDPAVAALMSKVMTDLPGKELLMIVVDYPPGGFDPVHRHDAHAMVYVLEGSIVMGVKGGKEVTLTPGQSFYEGPKDLHTVGRNASDSKPAKFLAVLVKDKNKPALIPVKYP